MKVNFLNSRIIFRACTVFIHKRSLQVQPLLLGESEGGRSAIGCSLLVAHDNKMNKNAKQNNLNRI